jgi:hypothetical protein
MRDFVEQINRKRGEQLTARAHGEAELKMAENAVRVAELEVAKKEVVANHGRAEPADARRGARQARGSFAAPSTCAATDTADIRALEIRAIAR